MGIDELLHSFKSASPVGGSTHTYYRYPARFSPQFAKAAIEAFSKPGDLVLDPFMGGGTTAVEALLAGRRFVGCDLNPLSAFISRVKTTPLNAADVEVLRAWTKSLDGLRLANIKHVPAEWQTYSRNVPWWLRKTMEAALQSVGKLRTARQQRFARCSLLKTAQWALDCRLEVPGKEDFIAKHHRDLASMLEGAEELRAGLAAAFDGDPVNGVRNRRILHRAAQGLDADARVPKGWLPSRLILTSPPYLGIHILYHRWQVRGRRETPAPYWVAGCDDGHGAAFYTFGDRHRKSPEAYLEHLRSAFQSVASLMSENSLLVQLVAFSNPGEQLSAYLDALREVGLVEKELYGSSAPERFWRDVPNRKWYADMQGGTASSREVLLIHAKQQA